MYDVRKLRPVRVGPKVRIGREADGGYVLPPLVIGRTRLLLSFGVATEWSFEEEFSKRNPAAGIYMYDYSTFLPTIVATMLVKVLKWDFPKVRHYWTAAVKYLSFLLGHPRVRFVRKYLDASDSKRAATFSAIMSGIGGGNPPGPLSVFVKMDIEGAEYRVIPSMLGYADVINGMAIEFHELGKHGGLFDGIIAMLQQHFAVIHVHANNYSPLIAGTSLPEALEITLLHKDLIPSPPTPDESSYPIAGLDFPNDPSRTDHRLIFS